MSKTDLIKSLKKLSHHLDPVVLLGAKGLTDAVHAEIESALEAHELIKIKLSSKDKTEKNVMAETICKKHKAILVNQIGHIIAIYRKRLES
ncbi:MAG: YhbY family RNA-binding protein [Coxiellaceae bacterium]|nr:YhbY family RNA-binding protein [Coxiellaceae bacterium]